MKISAATVLGMAVEAMARPWDWGAADCCTSASDVFLELAGVDPMLPLRGRYRTATGAARLIRRMGGWDAMTADLADAAGLTLVEPLAARPGDIGLTPRGTALGMGGQALAICVGGGGLSPFWAVKSSDGIMVTACGARAWRHA